MIGERVGAILCQKGRCVEFLGYGVYDGDFEPPNPPFGMTKEGYLKIWKLTNGDKPVRYFPNPRITLDSGKVVWGQECWWGPEDKIKKMLEGMDVVVVDIDVVRAESGGSK